MTKTKAIVGLLAAVVAAVIGVVALGAAQASASSAPVVITYTKTCDENAGTCVGTTDEDGDTLTMTITGGRPTGKAPHLTLTETIVGDDISFTAELSGHFSPAGFIVLNGRVTGDSESYAGARVHQRSKLTGAAGTTTSWSGELRLMPASA